MNSDITIRHTRPDEKHLTTYSSSIVEAVLTCPVWGIIRYVKNLYYPIAKRTLPLEAGSAMHEVFSAIRLWQLYRLQSLPDHFRFHGERLFGAERLDLSWKLIPDNPRDEVINFCFNILNSGEYYDDPDDTARTLSNMEHTLIKYVDDRMPKWGRLPIWVEDTTDPTKLVGIEMVFDTIVMWREQSMRYIGTLDGLVTPISKPNTVRVEDNKTASRIDDAYIRAWDVKNQITGYIAIAELVTGLACDNAMILATKIKQTRSQEDMAAIPQERHAVQLQDWVRSIFFAKEMVDRFGDEPLSAPQFTHSCSRYFRTCAFIDLCSAYPGDREAILATMAPAPQTPSQKALSDGTH